MVCDMRKLLLAAFFLASATMLLGLTGAAWYRYHSSDVPSAEFTQMLSEQVRGNTTVFYLSPSEAARYSVFLTIFRFGIGAVVILTIGIWAERKLHRNGNV